MEANQILHSDMLEILFEHRNKKYGAYELRRSYNKRIGISLGITGGLIAFIFLLSLLANSKTTEAKYRITDTVTLIHPPEEKVIKAKPLTSDTEPPKVASQQLTPPKIVIDSKVADEDVIPEIQDLSNSKIDVVSTDGIVDENIAIPHLEKQKGVIQPIVHVNESPFTKVEVEASFTGKLEKIPSKKFKCCNPSAEWCHDWFLYSDHSIYCRPGRKFKRSESINLTWFWNGRRSDKSYKSRT